MYVFVCMYICVCLCLSVQSVLFMQCVSVEGINRLLEKTLSIKT